MKLTYLIALGFILALFSNCSENKAESYEDKIDKRTAVYFKQREEILEKLFEYKIVEENQKFATHYSSNLINLDKKFESDLNAIEDSNGQKLKPFKFDIQAKQIKTEFTFSKDGNLALKYLYFKILNSGLNYIIRFLVSLIFVITISMTFTYCVKIDLLRVIFFHRYLSILILFLGIILSPAEYIGIANSSKQIQAKNLVEINLYKLKENVAEVKNRNLELSR